MIEKLLLKDDVPPEKSAPRAPAPRQRVERAPAIAQSVPFSSDAEQAVLSSMLQWPAEVIPIVVREMTEHYFHSPPHATIFRELLRLYSEGRPIELITFTQYMSDKKLLLGVGGPAFVTSLQLFVPSAANVEYYIQTLREKFLRREMIATGTHLVRAAYAQDTEVEEVIGNFSSKIDRIRRAASGRNGSERFELSKLREFDSKHDPKCLVGNRYLVRGGSSLWAGGSGYGKSSLALQLAVYWACGVPCFGMRPIGPLKSLIIEAENDEGDMAEQLQGVLAGIAALGDLDMETCRELIEKNVGIHRVEGKTGNAFLNLLSELVEYDRPQIVWPDPLFAFAGCDLLNAEKTGRFLREGLFPLASKYQVAMNVVHHVGKPVRDKDSAPIAEIDFQYLGFGTSEIQNAFRAVNILLPVAGTPGLFRLILSKRGERAGAKDSEGEWARSLYLKHSTEGICWVQSDKPEKPEKKTAGLKYTDHHVLDAMSIVNGIGARALQKHLREETGMSEPTFYRLWDPLKSAGKIKLDADGKWIKVADKLELK